MNRGMHIKALLGFVLITGCSQEQKDDGANWYAVEMVARSIATAEEIEVMDALQCDSLLFDLGKFDSDEECNNALSSHSKREGADYFCSPKSARNDRCKDQGV